MSYQIKNGDKLTLHCLKFDKKNTTRKKLLENMNYKRIYHHRCEAELIHKNNIFKSLIEIISDAS